MSLDITSIDLHSRGACLERENSRGAGGHSCASKRRHLIVLALLLGYGLSTGILSMLCTALPLCSDGWVPVWRKLSLSPRWQVRYVWLPGLASNWWGAAARWGLVFCSRGVVVVRLACFQTVCKKPFSSKQWLPMTGSNVGILFTYFLQFVENVAHLWPDCFHSKRCSAMRSEVWKPVLRCVWIFRWEQFEDCEWDT